MLHTVPSQRDALTRRLREEAIAALAQAELWPAEPARDRGTGDADPARPA